MALGELWDARVWMVVRSEVASWGIPGVIMEGDGIDGGKVQ